MDTSDRVEHQHAVIRKSSIVVTVAILAAAIACLAAGCSVSGGITGENGTILQGFMFTVGAESDIKRAAIARYGGEVAVRQERRYQYYNLLKAAVENDIDPTLVRDAVSLVEDAPALDEVVAEPRDLEDDGDGD